MTRLEIMEHHPKGDEHRYVERFENASPISRDNQSLCQFEEVAGRRRRLSLFHRGHGACDLLDFKSVFGRYG